MEFRALVKKKQADNKYSPLSFILPFHLQTQISNSVAMVKWENIVKYYDKWVFNSIFFYYS